MTAVLGHLSSRIPLQSPEEMCVGKGIVDGPHRLDIAVRTSTPVRSIDYASQMEFGFGPLSNSGIVPLTTSNTGNQQKKKPRTRKNQRSEASRPSNRESHESFQRAPPGTL